MIFSAAVLFMLQKFTFKLSAEIMHCIETVKQ